MATMEQMAIVFLPATDSRPAEPAPFLMTDAEVTRLMRLDGVADPYQSLKRYRQKGWLKGTQMGNHVRYQLPDVLKCLRKAADENPR